MNIIFCRIRDLLPVNKGTKVINSRETKTINNKETKIISKIIIKMVVEMIKKIQNITVMVSKWVQLVAYYIAKQTAPETDSYLYFN